jgi:glycosyltransferase involved in cell wall biosynthesis
LKLSVIICTLDRPHFIGDAVGSILANDHASFEVLVVDQSADDSTARSLEVFEDVRLRYIHSSRVGVSVASNLGARAARADILCFTDDDCRVPRDWLSRYEKTFQERPDVDLVFGQMLVAPELVNRPMEIPTFEIAERRYIHRDKDAPWPWSVGANYGVRRSLYESLGGHDEMLGCGALYESANDFDLTYRAFRGRAGILLEPELYVWHYGERDPAQWKRRLHSYGLGDGAFCAKHVRSGDMALFRLFAGRLLRLSVREALNVFRRKPSKRLYIQGCMAGIMRSRKQPINRQKRLYTAGT